MVQFFLKPGNISHTNELALFKFLQLEKAETETFSSLTFLCSCSNKTSHVVRTNVQGGMAYIITLLCKI